MSDAKAFTVAAAQKTDLLKKLHGAVNSAIQNGESLADFRVRFDKIANFRKRYNKILVNSSDEHNA